MDSSRRFAYQVNAPSKDCMKNNNNVHPILSVDYLWRAHTWKCNKSDAELIFGAIKYGIEASWNLEETIMIHLRPGKAWWQGDGMIFPFLLSYLQLTTSAIEALTVRLNTGIMGSWSMVWSARDLHAHGYISRSIGLQWSWYRSLSYLSWSSSPLLLPCSIGGHSAS